MVAALQESAATNQDAVTCQIASLLRKLAEDGRLTIQTQLLRIPELQVMLEYNGPVLHSDGSPNVSRVLMAEFAKTAGLGLQNFSIVERFCSDGSATIQHGNLRRFLIRHKQLDPRPVAVEIESTEHETTIRFGAKGGQYFEDEEIRKLVAGHLNRTKGWDTARLNLLYEDGYVDKHVDWLAAIREQLREDNT